MSELGDPHSNPLGTAGALAEDAARFEPGREMVVRGWRRIAHKLKGEGLAFQTWDRRPGFDALVLGTTEQGFLIFDPERHDDRPIVAGFAEVRGITPLSEARSEELRASYERSHAAS